LHNTFLLCTLNGMSETTSAIKKLVEQAGGPVELSRKLGGVPAYQEIQRWVKRGWASPMHLFRLEPHMPKGMKLRDLNRDREAAKGAPFVPEKEGV
jgi:hypothetical protein